MWDLFQAFLIAHPVAAIIVGAAILIGLRLFRLNLFRNVFRDSLQHWLRKPSISEQDPPLSKKE